MNKRLAVLCLALVLVCALLTGCSDGAKDLSGSKYVGTWKAESMTIMGEAGEFEAEHLLELNPDGTARFVSGEEVSKCKWDETRDGVKLTNGANVNFKEDSEGLKTTFIGVELLFKKQ